MLTETLKDGSAVIACNVCGGGEFTMPLEQVDMLKQIDPEHWDGYMCSDCQVEQFHPAGAS